MFYRRVLPAALVALFAWFYLNGFRKGASVHQVCIQISEAVSSATNVHYPDNAQYHTDIRHWATSSSQPAECTVKPGTAADVGIILGILGSSRTPFAVKGGGHSLNPGFASTTGVLISMSRFNEITYDAASQTAVIGAGLIWDDVYAALAPHKVTVLGGRVMGIGVAGFLLGGGYSWKANQHGLAIDSITAIELVKPTGTISKVTEESDPELFSALKGGLNNFGIVTRFWLKTYPQGQIWGGSIIYGADSIPAVSAATTEFSSNATDAKASIITNYFFVGSQKDPAIVMLLFYDAPTPPDGVFDCFLEIPSIIKDLRTRDLLEFVQSSNTDSIMGLRGVYHTIPLARNSPRVLDVVLDEISHWGSRLGSHSGLYTSYSAEPFLPTILSHGSSQTAYPPDRSRVYLPFNIYFQWTDPSSDSYFHDVARQSAARIYEAALAEGQDIQDAALYPNYAIFGTPLARMYGSNLAALRSVKARVDPANVMGLAGGFKF